MTKRIAGTELEGKGKGCRAGEMGLGEEETMEDADEGIIESTVVQQTERCQRRRHMSASE